MHESPGLDLVATVYGDDLGDESYRETRGPAADPPRRDVEAIVAPTSAGRSTPGKIPTGIRRPDAGATVGVVIAALIVIGPMLIGRLALPILGGRVLAHRSEA